MKRFALLCLLFVSYNSFAQNFNIGGNVGVIPEMGSGNYTVYPETATLFTLDAAIEYRPGKSIFSINTDPFVFLNASEFVFTEPLYLKASIGKAFKFCPALGGFIRTNGNYGFLLGASFEYVLNDKLIVFLNGHVYKDYYEVSKMTHWGTTVTSTSVSNSLLINVGMKRTVKLKSKKG